MFINRELRIKAVYRGCVDRELGIKPYSAGVNTFEVWRKHCPASRSTPMYVFPISLAIKRCKGSVNPFEVGRSNGSLRQYVEMVAGGFNAWRCGARPPD